MNRLQTLMTQYGWIALLLHYAIFFASLAGFAMAIELGFDLDQTDALPDGWFAQWLFSWLPVKWVGAYIATKVVQPARIAATLVLTPYAARLLPRRAPPESVLDDPEVPFTRGAKQAEASDSEVSLAAPLTHARSEAIEEHT